MSIAVESFRKATTTQVRMLRPRRVLLVTQASGGGVGRHFCDLAEGLVRRGVEVVGIYSPRKLDAACRARLASADLPPMHQFPMRRAIHLLDAFDTWKLVRLIRRLGRFDLIHGHSSKGGALARLAARWLGVPSVYTPNAFVTLDPTLPAWQRGLYGRVECWLARSTAAIIAVSQEEAEHAHSLGIDRRKIHVVFNGTDPPLFPSREAARARLQLSDEQVVIGFVGRLAPQKAPDTMLRAFAELARQQRNVRLVMVGSGPLERDIRQLVNHLNVSNQVVLLGDVIATDVMPAFDLFCLSSRYEGLPYVLIEALHASLPIITTRVQGASLCVEPERNGVVVPIDDVRALAAALVRLTDDASLRQSFAAASLELAPRFSAQHMVDRTVEVYRQVMGQSYPTNSSPDVDRIELLLDADGRTNPVPLSTPMFHSSMKSLESPSEHP